MMDFSDLKNIEEAYRNSYDVLFNDVQYESIMEKGRSYFLHHPSKPISIELLLDMTDFFSAEEEFEKCVIIKKFIDERHN
mgnify:CR=1 FL=1|tara:strand:+ start:792 stop:1031 length:240 start_codon:yes stop_codon:yes gene_type:complete